LQLDSIGGIDKLFAEPLMDKTTSVLVIAHHQQLMPSHDHPRLDAPTGDNFLQKASAKRSDSLASSISERGDSQPPIRIPVPGLSSSMNSVRVALQAAHSKRTSLPISTIVKFIPIPPENSPQITKLEHRGGLIFGRFENVVNDGQPLEISLKDATIGSIRLSFPSHVAADVSEDLHDGSITFRFKKPVVTILQGLALKYNIAPNQLLDSVTVGTERVEYDFHSGSNITDQTQLIIDLKGAANISR
jgi:hypothetical protein